MPKLMPSTHPMSRLRHKKGRTLQQVAEATGISKASLSRIEQWVQYPTCGAMLSLIEFYDGVLCPNDFFSPGLDGRPSGESASAEQGVAAPIEPVSECSRASEIRGEIETAYDLLTALDKAGDGIGGDVGHGVSAVALAARAALDNARNILRSVLASDVSELGSA